MFKERRGERKDGKGVVTFGLLLYGVVFVLMGFESMRVSRTHRMYRPIESKWLLLPGLLLRLVFCFGCGELQLNATKPHLCEL